MSDRPAISVVLCTHNRAALLELALESLTNQTMSDDEFEIVVVDNASTDLTAQATRAFADRVSLNVHYVLEPELGLSAARNTGIAHARSSLIAFLDDDAVASDQWLEALKKGFDDESRAWSVGGPVRPLWEVPRPDWLADHLLVALSVIDWGDEARMLTWPERHIGANVAFRRQVLEEHAFNPDLGRKGDALFGFEDTEIQERIHADDGGVYYVPEAEVHHRVPAERVTMRYHARRAHGSGQSEVVLRMTKGESPVTILLKALAGAPRRILAVRGIRQPSWKVQYLMSMAHLAGLLRGSLAKIAGRGNASS